MKKIIFILLTCLTSITAQNFHSPQNKKLFADHLFCEGDFLRAVLEYQEYPDHIANDTILFKTAYGYKNLERFDEAEIWFNSIPESSVFYDNSKLLFLEALVKQKKFEFVIQQETAATGIDELKIIYLSNLINSNIVIDKHKFISAFKDEEVKEVRKFYEYKIDPPYKSPVAAGILSALIPGSGKIYTGQLSEGLTAFVITSLFAFISYNNFAHDHNVRGWLFAGAGAMFYAGNVYGSAVSAENYNIKIDYEYNRNVLDYLDSKKYYTDDFNFCD